MNSQNEFVVGNLIVTTPSDWLDVTEGIGSDETPFTLARNDGVGALQFSVGTYESGTAPDITLESLRTLLDDFAFSRELGKAFDEVRYESPVLVMGRSYRTGNNFVRVWYCSNGKDIALVTYTCENRFEGIELKDCNEILAKIRFDSKT